MKIYKLLFILLLPLTIVLDFIVYSLIQSCPSCSNFSQFLWQEGAISFPIVVGLTEWFNGLINSFKKTDN